MYPMSTTNDDAIWYKSTYSGGQGGNCLEWAPASVSSGVVPVRDSKDTSRPGLRFSPAAWDAFVAAVKRAER